MNRYEVSVVYTHPDNFRVHEWQVRDTHHHDEVVATYPGQVEAEVECLRLNLANDR